MTVHLQQQISISYDTTEEHDGVTGAYILEAGDYYFATGNGAHDAVRLFLKEQYRIR